MALQECGLNETQALGFRCVTEKDMWGISKNNYWQGNWTGEMFAEVLLVSVLTE